MKSTSSNQHAVSTSSSSDDVFKINIPPRILIVLPYSGRQFGGGLAVLNQELTKALADNGYDVKLLTMKIPGNGAIKEDEHKPATILYIENSEVAKMHDPGGAAGEKDRERLYELINSDEVILNSSVFELITVKGWIPDIIIGHSRFSGAAAIKLRDKFFNDAKVEYFLHSFPVEGSVLTGYEAYEERIDAEVAKEKFKKEQKWMPQADIVMAMGPLLKAGATLILEQTVTKGKARIHECIPGVVFKNKPVEYKPPEGPIKLLLLGRASAPIKGLEDILLAAIKLKNLGYDILIDILYWDTRTYIRNKKVLFEGTHELPKITVEEVGILDVDAVQRWVDGLLGETFKQKRMIQVLGKTNTPHLNICASHAVLMPSYIEHFGLVPFEATECGVPVLVNEISGAGMFLADEKRCGKFGVPCVVLDFDKNKKRPLQPQDFLTDVSINAFDDRPDAWFDAILKLVKDLEVRFENAKELRKILEQYTYRDFARTLVLATRKEWNGKNTVQGLKGEVLEIDK